MSARTFHRNLTPAAPRVSRLAPNALSRIQSRPQVWENQFVNPQKQWYPHQSVLKDEVVKSFQPVADRFCYRNLVLLDATLGCGGHSVALVQNIPTLKYVLGIDYDTRALTLADRNLRIDAGMEKCSATQEIVDLNALHRPVFRLVHGSFVAAPSMLSTVKFREGSPGVDLMLLDLGMSSAQIDNPERGFSFMKDGPLDMRMDDSGMTGFFTAKQILEDSTKFELAEILRLYGEEKYANSIATQIKRQVRRNDMHTTRDLRKACDIVYCKMDKEYEDLVKNRKKPKIDCSTKTFQALRIAVNKELESVDLICRKVPSLLHSGGRVAFITFHSLEEKVLLRFIEKWDRERTLRHITWKGALIPGSDEMHRNHRSRSARMYVCEMV